jgi:hypothetical protein
MFVEERLHYEGRIFCGEGRGERAEGRGQGAEGRKESLMVCYTAYRSDSGCRIEPPSGGCEKRAVRVMKKVAQAPGSGDIGSRIAGCFTDSNG